MKLKHVHIENYARLPKIDLELRKHGILIGRNDVGKTSILRCLNFLLGASASHLYTNIVAADFQDPLLPIRISATLVDFTDRERRVFPDEISVSLDGVEHLKIALEAQAVPGDESLSIRRYFPESGTSRQPTRDQFRAIGWKYVPALRAGGAEAIDGRLSALRELLEGVELGTEKTALSEALGQFDDALAKSPALLALRDSMASHLTESLPGGMSGRALSIKSIATSDDVLRAVALYMDEHGTVRPIAEQSDGMNALVALTLIDLAASGANIIAVDEPETHLHPASQRALAGLFAKGENQKLIATHSPFIIQKFDPEYVIAFSPTRTCRQLASGALTAYDKAFIHWWTSSKLEPLTARWVLLVEGPADRAIVESCCRAVGCNPDSSSISIVELGGADGLDAAYKLFGPSGFGIGVMGLVDEDHEEKWAETLGMATGELAKTNIFVARKDLEQEYVDALGRDAVIDALCSSGIYTESRIAATVGVADISQVSTEQILEFCGHKKRKVYAALAVSQKITKAHVDSMRGMKSLVERLQKG